eukprot:SAG11_NODE_11949_length_730_cov_0.876387_1_plen_37_part_10
MTRIYLTNLNVENTEQTRQKIYRHPFIGRARVAARLH